MLLTKNLKLLIGLIILLLALQSCRREPVVKPTKEYPGVDTELWMYFQKFEEASAERGIHVDLAKSGITGTIENLNIGGVMGLCNYNMYQPNQIIIDKAFWARSASLRKELIVFHELGHCYMQLGHRDDTHDDGRCKSIMRSGLGGCMDMYLHDNRNAYLDELFY